ncbi:keratin-associated protein 5-8-like [Mercenaria mercenaria]|uniref:keratin-associated protein 5-8-like n=1 Tax=Mercenaria mercenaria TaxID=6596 RepID=UPI00234E5123|nr:keratin-associated protein 5-8-like [Mercenaria mercenaria]
MRVVGLIYITCIASTFVHCQEEVGKCVCREYRCEGYEHNAGSCEMRFFHSGYGSSCCKPYCTCRESCNPGESNEGRNGIPSYRWGIANSGTKDEAGSCPINQTFCCPTCLCRSKCKVAEVNIAKASCGSNDVLCCTNQTRNWRCDDGEIFLGKSYNKRYCGRCSCRKTCSTGEIQQSKNKCQKNHELCCKTCTCKSTCTGNETVMNHGKCAASKKMCCEDCKCKTGCDVTERDQGKDTCQYGLTRCCYP